MSKDLKDTPFAIERLFVWGIGVVMVIASITTATMSYQGKKIPPQLQSMTMLTIGIFAARIERKIR